MDHFTGSCLCGDVRIVATGRPNRVGLCHCMDCRSAGEIEVHLGALDAPDQFIPTYENWTVRREAWLPPFPLAHHYEHNREAAGPFDV